MESKTIRELRKQNKRLVKEVQQLRRKLNQLHELDFDRGCEIESEQEHEVQEALSPPVFICPQCQSHHTVVFQLIGQDYYRCEECESRGWCDPKGKRHSA
jgi:tRNA(Ile2) C34 agmatinyltransferase TiaS